MRGEQFVRAIAPVGALIIAACAGHRAAPVGAVPPVWTPSALVELSRSGGTDGSDGRYSDEAVRAHVERVGLALAIPDPSPGVPWTFEVMDDASPRAYTLGGGYVCISRGLLAQLSSDSELAAVLTAEMRDPSPGALGVARAGMDLPPEVGAMGYAPTRGYTSFAAYDSRAAAPRFGRDSYLRMLDGMVYGRDPRAGYFEGARFVRPDLAIQIDFPPRWMTRDDGNAAMAASLEQDAFMELRRVHGEATLAAHAFFTSHRAQQGSLSSGTINGFVAVRGEFTAITADGSPVRGVATFVDVGLDTFLVLAYARSARFAAYAETFDRTAGSLATLVDPVALAVRPARLRLERVPRAMTLEEFDAAFPSMIGLAELGALNRMETQSSLQTGEWVKRVVQ